MGKPRTHLVSLRVHKTCTPLSLTCSTSLGRYMPFGRNTHTSANMPWCAWVNLITQPCRPKASMRTNFRSPILVGPVPLRAHYASTSNARNSAPSSPGGGVGGPLRTRKLTSRTSSNGTTQPRLGTRQRTYLHSYVPGLTESGTIPSRFATMQGRLSSTMRSWCRLRSTMRFPYAAPPKVVLWSSTLTASNSLSHLKRSTARIVSTGAYISYSREIYHRRLLTRSTLGARIASPPPGKGR
jgi:hypothetical protein